MIQLMLGDCLQKLTELPDNSVDSIVTDPPYGLSFMGKAWDYDVPGQNIWAECLRVLKPGGHLLAFFGTRTYHRGVCRIEDAGFDIKDQIQWIYGQGFPKSHNLKGEWQGWGCALKPANEPIVVAQKPISEKTIAANVLKWGTGALNIDGSRIGTEMIQGGRAGRTGKSNFNASIGQAQDMHQGRWPSNVLLDEEAAKALDEQSGTLKSGARKAGKKKDSGVTYQVGGVSASQASEGGASRFFYVAKASPSERNRGLEGMPQGEVRSAGGTTSSGKPTMEVRDRFGSVQSNFHPTVKPVKLMGYLIKLVTPVGGFVLDPFMGSGTTGVSAKMLGFAFIGIEREPQYMEIAQKRIESAHEVEEKPDDGQLEFPA